MIAKEFQMTTYILIVMCAVIIIMLGALLMRPSTLFGQKIIMFSHQPALLVTLVLVILYPHQQVVR